MDPLKPRDKFADRFTLLSKLASGGMGDVWKARDTVLDRDVALKVSKTGFTARFTQEARATAAFNHPNICRIYDVVKPANVMLPKEGGLKPLDFGLAKRQPTIRLSQSLPVIIAVTPEIGRLNAASDPLCRR